MRKVELLFRKLSDWSERFQRTTELDDNVRLYGQDERTSHGFWFRPSLLAGSSGGVELFTKLNSSIVDVSFSSSSKRQLLDANISVSESGVMIMLFQVVADMEMINDYGSEIKYDLIVDLSTQHAATRLMQIETGGPSSVTSGGSYQIVHAKNVSAGNVDITLQAWCDDPLSIYKAYVRRTRGVFAFFPGQTLGSVS